MTKEEYNAEVRRIHGEYLSACDGAKALYDKTLWYLNKEYTGKGQHGVMSDYE